MDGLSRRELMGAGMMSALPGLEALAHASERNSNVHRRPASRVILVYLLGGPSHLDTWDLKPDAPEEIRGPFSPIPTSVPGIAISEYLPKLAQRANRLSIVRTVGYANNDHPYMTYHTLTGRISPVPLGANTVLPPTRSDHPHMGSIVSKFHHQNASIPGYVAIPEVFVRMGPQPVAGGGKAGYLGPQYDPLPINDDPTKRLPALDLPDTLSAGRFESRRKLLTVLDGRDVGSPRSRRYHVQRQTATRLVGRSGGGLLDLSDETAATHEQYGRDRFGQSLLLARRLVERGVSFAGVHFNYMTKCDGWDTHKDNFNCLSKELLPMLDRGLSALLDDLSDRGLLDETLVLTMGEFGRTPKINAAAGRDHWGPCGSAVIAGGPIRGGTVIGESDAHGAYPLHRPVAPADVTASVFHALDLNPEQMMYDTLARPLPLSPGNVIPELFG